MANIKIVQEDAEHVAEIICLFAYSDWLDILYQTFTNYLDYSSSNPVFHILNLTSHWRVELIISPSKRSYQALAHLARFHRQKNNESATPLPL